MMRVEVPGDEFIFITQHISGILEPDGYSVQSLTNAQGREMSSSLDEEAGLLFGVTADNFTNHQPFGPFHDTETQYLPLALSSRSLFLSPLPSLSRHLHAHWSTSERNPAILSQSESVPRRDRKQRRRDQEDN